MQLNAQFQAIIYKLNVKNAFWLLKLYCDNNLLCLK